MTIGIRFISLFLVLLSIVVSPQSQANQSAYEHQQFYDKFGSSFSSLEPTTPHHNIKQFDKTPRVLTLKEAILLALRYNPNIKSSELNRVLDKFSLRLAYNDFEFRYKLTGDTRWNRTKTDGNLSHSQSYNLQSTTTFKTYDGTRFRLSMDHNFDGDTYNPRLTFGIDRPLIRGARSSVVTAPLLNAIDQEHISRLAFERSVIDEITIIINNYRALIGQLNNYEIQKRSLKRNRENLERTKKKIAAGRLAPADLPQAEISVVRNQANLVQAKNTTDDSRRRLLLSIGLDPDLPIRIDKTIKIDSLKIPDKEKSIAIALHNDSKFQSDLLTLEIDKRALLVAEDNKLWQLDFGFISTFGGGSGPGRNAGIRSLFNGANNTQTYTLKLDIPVDDLSLTSAVVSARTKFYNQQIITETDKRQIIDQVLDAIYNIETEKRTIEIDTLAVKLAKQNLVNAYKRLQYGRITMFEVTERQDDLTTDEVTLLTGQIRYLDAVTKYQQILQTTLDIWNIQLRY